ncbi:arsenic transporter [Paenibacillus sp. 1001270B_150601_E10]|uniref:arsenic transporter n=1 Tax=Paenibacillus sp. 1001270B_150601_E10 TaxID=2787079 RepID=UPI00189ED273|nr:arsenic transporter [Paenibacillus sp. 1001270B_150601_E10]
MVIGASLLFIITLIFVIWQPRGLSIGWPASIGALLALLFGIVSLQDIVQVTSMVWNATFTFIAIIIISMILDEIGFFEWAALHMALLAKGKGTRLYISIIILGAIVSAFFANDGAALILTPIVLAMVRALHFEEKYVIPIVIASGFIADTASIPFTISNLVNIVAADFFGIGFAEYASRMVVVFFVSCAASIGVLLLYYRKHLPPQYQPEEVPVPSSTIKDIRLFRLSWVILGVLMLAYFTSEWTHLPVSFIGGIAAFVLWLAARRSPAIETTKIIKEAPWTIVIFSIGMYVVVFGLRNAGLTDLLGQWIQWFAQEGVVIATLGMGVLSAFLSSVMNNLPTVMIGSLSIDTFQAEPLIREALIYANIIGSDLGPKMTPIGSLATLIWLHVLSRKGIQISWKDYCKVGVVITIPTLLITLLGLAGWLYFIH